MSTFLDVVGFMWALGSVLIGPALFLGFIWLVIWCWKEDNKQKEV